MISKSTKIFTAILTVFLLCYTSFSFPTTAFAVTCAFGTSVGSQCRGYLTSGTTWTVPSDWTNSGNTIEVIGGGAGDGGGGGAYSEISNLSLTVGGTAYLNIGAGGIGNNNQSGGDTWFNTSNTPPISATTGALAKGGITQGAGGAAASGVGNLKYSGGASALGANGTDCGGSGHDGGSGGGAAGPHGNGNDGGSYSVGGAGDAGFGGAPGNPVGSQNGVVGGNGTEWDASHGSGAGGGGGYNDPSCAYANGGDGANGGSYGAGGGGGSWDSYDGWGGSGGSGMQGIVVITYTPVVVPSMTTNSTSSVLPTSATLSGSITATGGADATQSGFQYSTNATLSSGVTTTTLGGQTGTATFTSSISSLSPSTTYYYRAYATNSGGTGYGNIVNFTTGSSATAPTVTTNSASSFMPNTANLIASITNNGGADAAQTGFAYGTVSNLSTLVATTTLGGFTGTGSFYGTITSLSANTSYYYRAYATNSGGTGYGSILSFTTGNSIPWGRIRLLNGFRIRIISGSIKVLPL